MARDDETPGPPDWALPAWDATTEDGGRRPTARSLPGERLTPRGMFGLRILGVSEVTRAVREAIRSDERLREVWVEGEVGRVTISSAGHAYFSLKDERSQLQCVWFRDDRLASPFEPQAGLRVVVQGRVDVFDAQGVYQLYVNAVQPAGFGDLAIRFEALKAKLAAEGLFDAGRKRPLPDRPRIIAVATSGSGAVWHDIRTVLIRRWPLAVVVLSPCQVQGDPAPASIVEALRRIDRYAAQCDARGRDDLAPAVTILARGGGSLEDLWPFNDERVVRAVVAHRRPVVCGVGHETDVTLADFAADRRAATPSAAAEIVVPDQAEVAESLASAGQRLEGATRRAVGSATREVAAEWRALESVRPATQLAAARERAGLLLDRATRAVLDRASAARVEVDRASSRLLPTVGRTLGNVRGSLAAGAAALAVLGPQATLERGYAIVRRDPDDRILRRPVEAPAGTPLSIRLADGELGATSTGDRGRSSNRVARRRPADR